MLRELPRLLTIAQLADSLHVPVSRVRHILATRKHIQPVAMASQVRIFSHVALAQLRYEINRQDAFRADSPRSASPGSAAAPHLPPLDGQAEASFDPMNQGGDHEQE